MAHTALDQHDPAETIRRFLMTPLNRRHFERFFELCLAETSGYLRRLKASGWRLPTDQVQAERSITDLGCDILGFLLATYDGQPFKTVFDYYHRHGVTDFAKADASFLTRHFRILVRGYARQRVTKLATDANPQIKHLKKRLAEILASSGYSRIVRPGFPRQFVCKAVNGQNLRDDRPALPDERLLRIVQTAFRDTITRTDWCTRVFALLDEEREFQNAVPLSGLIAAMTAVNAEYIDALEYVQDRPTGPLGEYRFRKIQSAVELASQWIEQTGVVGYIGKGRITPDEAVVIVKACREWLQDFCLSGEADSIPSYFMRFRPDTDQRVYQERYKNAMDCITRKALEEVRRLLREDSTIWPFGGYLPDE